MADQTVQTPPPLIQDPESSNPKPILLSKSDDKTQFDSTKVFAAVGLILTATLIIVGLLWITVQNLEQRVNTLEEEAANVTTKSATTAAAQVASRAATKSAE